MAKLFDPLRMLRGLRAEMRRRAVAGDLSLPFELGLQLEDRRFQLAASSRTVKIVEDRIGRSYLRCDLSDFTRVVLGMLDMDAAVSAGRVEVSTRIARQAVDVIFPRLPLWRPPLDGLME